MSRKSPTLYEYVRVERDCGRDVLCYKLEGPAGRPNRMVMDHDEADEFTNEQCQMSACLMLEISIDESHLVEVVDL